MTSNQCRGSCEMFSESVALLAKPHTAAAAAAGSIAVASAVIDIALLHGRFHDAYISCFPTVNLWAQGTCVLLPYERLACNNSIDFLRHGMFSCNLRLQYA